MENPQLPADLLHWTLALLPIVVLLVLLRWKAPQAAPMGMFTAAAVALFAFATPWETVAAAGCPKGRGHLTIMVSSVIGGGRSILSDRTVDRRRLNRC